MTDVVVFDIDGTLADVSQRRRHLEGSEPDWKRFHASMDMDTPNLAIVELYKALWSTARFKIVLTSGRHERARQYTEKWLFWNHIPFDTLYMRPNEDGRPDHLLKQDFLSQITKAHGMILFAVDDRQQVVDMWRRNGIACLQCAPGDF
ncbi:phosphatase domain-containing protein (plasmid) [Rhizobium leguminosarum]